MLDCFFWEAATGPSRRALEMDALSGGAAGTGGDLEAQTGFSGRGSIPPTAATAALDHSALEAALEAAQTALMGAKADFSVLGESGRVLSMEKGVCHSIDPCK